MLKSLVINKERCLLNQDVEDLLDLLDGYFVILVYAARCATINLIHLRLRNTVLGRLHIGGVLVNLSTAASYNGCAFIVDKGKKGVLRWSPGDTELLHMNYLVSVNDLTDELLDLLVIHLPDLVEPDLITLLEALELLLQLLKLARELLVVVSQLDVLLLELCALGVEPLFGLRKGVPAPALLDRQ